MFDFSSINIGDFKLYLIILAISIIGLIITRKLLKVSFPYFFMGLIGLIIGLLLGALISSPLYKLPGEYGKWIPLIVNIFVVVAVLDLFMAHAKSTSEVADRLFKKLVYKEKINNPNIIVVDTSVLIDGRIENIAEVGFLMSKLIIPRFVLEELHRVADSSDTIKRSRGKKGLEVLSSLQKNKHIDLEISDFNAKNKEVDYALLEFAKEKNAKIMTVDYNLNKISQIEGVQVLNINELSESLKPVLIPGEEIVVKVIQKGKEKNQGVAYLSDGTMVVIENGGKFVGEMITSKVIRIFHTVAGKMIFVEPKGKKFTHPKENI